MIQCHMSTIGVVKNVVLMTTAVCSVLHKISRKNNKTVFQECQLSKELQWPAGQMNN